MWSALFGAEDGEQQQQQQQQRGDPNAPAPVPVPAPDAAAGQRKATDASEAAVAPPAPSASSSAPAPRHSMEQSSTATPPPSLSRRPSQYREDDREGDDDDSPMAMLLRRLNVLMVKAGQHEFEKKTLVDQMEKERELMRSEVAALERQVQDLKDQNLQLQYKIEYTSEPMLMERLQDVTDMRDALTRVKEQQERDLEAKEKMLQETRQQLAQKEAELQTLRDEMEAARQLHEQEQAAVEEQVRVLETRLAEAARVADDASIREQKDAEELESLRVSVASLTKQNGDLAATLEEREREIERLEHLKENELTQLNEQLEHTRRTSEVRLAEKERQVSQMQAEMTEKGTALEKTLQEKITQLESQLQDADNRISEMTSVMDDYKHDCMELWKLNEDLKQQLALAAAETMLKEAESRQKEFSGQSRVSDLESQVEELRDAVTRKEQELVLKEEELLSAREEAARLVESSKRHEESQPWKENAIRVLTEQVTAAQRELTEAMELNLHMSNRNSWLEEQLVNLEAAVSAAEQANDKLQPTVEASLIEQVNGLHQSNSALSTELHAVKTEWDATSQELESLKLTFQQMREELDVAQNLASEAVQSSKHELESEIERLGNALNQERQHVAALESEVSHYRAELEPLQSQIDTLARKNHSLLGEISDARDVHEKAEAQKNLQMEQLQATVHNLKAELQRAGEVLSSKESEIAALRDASASETAKLKSGADKLKDEKRRMLAELKQLRADAESHREAQDKASAERVALLTEVDKHLKEVSRLQTMLKKAEKEKAALESDANQLRAVQDEKNRIVEEARQLEVVNRRLEETNQELEATLERSKAFCEDVSQRCEEKVIELQEANQRALEERAEEVAQMTLANGSLRREIEQLAESRFEQERFIEELRLQVADLQAEKNVLAARAHRLMQELSQYTELPDEELLADSQSPAPDLWELLSSGMEQLKADLELASKYAASIDSNAVDDGPESEESLPVSSS
ncbi:hypothetical protein ATCC90586_006724 [Pythium insidiosum]|nr:hypothetical protein ATCC90586_006724 [Pythium insidiosum]